ncbi:chromosome 6 open reading frame 57 [Nesidiocoris tenuis]|nr:chromosome 6 open reading frame 57 [Nesidiocoris tenuis]
MLSARRLLPMVIQRPMCVKTEPGKTTPKERGPTDEVKKDLKKDTKTLKEFRKTPIGKLDELAGSHPYAEKEPLPEWPDGVNPHTGEIGGPKGVEPTRYGDWERKGRVTDF